MTQTSKIQVNWRLLFDTQPCISAASGLHATYRLLLLTKQLSTLTS